jgi:hypothetical protein
VDSSAHYQNKGYLDGCAVSAGPLCKSGGCKACVFNSISSTDASGAYEEHHHHGRQRDIAERGEPNPHLLLPLATNPL